MVFGVAPRFLELNVKIYPPFSEKSFRGYFNNFKTEKKSQISVQVAAVAIIVLPARS